MGLDLRISWGDLTDLVSVREGPIAQPPWDGVFAFNEDEASTGQVSAA